MASGVHIIADLYKCDFDFWISKHDLGYISRFFKKLIKDAGLNVLDVSKYSFGKDSFSLIYMLSESHVSIHTWPEINYISFDMFVCNYTKDNTKIAKDLANQMILYFKPGEKKIKTIKR